LGDTQGLGDVALKPALLLQGKYPVSTSCSAGKQRFVDLGSCRRRKRYGQPATCAKRQGGMLLLARYPATSHARTPRCWPIPSATVRQARSRVLRRLKQEMGELLD